MRHVLLVIENFRWTPGNWIPFGGGHQEKAPATRPQGLLL